VVATMSSVGFGLSPAAGRAIMELLRDRRCSFADIGSFNLSRFANLTDHWREERGWIAATPIRAKRTRVASGVTGFSSRSPQGRRLMGSREAAAHSASPVDRDALRVAEAAYTALRPSIRSTCSIARRSG
jgi:hypothetical protein